MRLARCGLVFLALVLVGVVVAIPLPSPSPPCPGPEIHRRLLAGIAWIQAPDRGKGTGFVVDPDRRWLVTCHHVAGDGDTLEAIFPWRLDDQVVSARRLYLEKMADLRKRGLVVRGKVLRRSPQTDLALVELEKLPPGTRALSLAETSAVPGQRVHLAGNRYDVDVLWTHGTGTVRTTRTLREGYFTGGKQLARGARSFLASVPINEGDSGAPLVDDAGRVVGVSAAVAWEVQGSALCIDRAEIEALLGARPAAPPGGAPPRRENPYRLGAVSTACIQYEGGEPRGGVLLDRERKLVLTTARAVGKEERVEATFPVEQAQGLVVEAAWYRTQRELLRRKGSLTRGIVLAVDPRRNLALVEIEQVPAGVAPLQLVRQTPRPGDPLHLISHPRRLDVLWTYAAGWVRQSDHVNLGETTAGPDPAVIIAQAPLGSGEEGGPVLDAQGGLVGIASGRIGPQQQVAFVLAASEVAAFLDEHRPRAAPRTPVEHCERGLLFVRAHHLSEADRAYTAALALDARHVPGLVGRAWVRHLRGQDDLALADASRALEHEPRSAAALRHRAAAWIGKGQPARAITDLEGASKIDPKSAFGYALRGWAHLRSGQVERAVADADEAIWLDARLALGYRVRGLAHARGGALAKALGDLGRAIALDPLDVRAHVERGDLHRRNDDEAAALADYQQAAKLLRQTEGVDERRLEAIDQEKDPGRKVKLLGELLRRVRDGSKG